jgi:hypothetical protein
MIPIVKTLAKPIQNTNKTPKTPNNSVPVTPNTTPANTIINIIKAEES